MKSWYNLKKSNIYNGHIHDIVGILNYWRINIAHTLGTTLFWRVPVWMEERRYPQTCDMTKGGAKVIHFKSKEEDHQRAIFLVAC